MANTYYDSQLTDEQIEAALTAIDGVVTPENNGKVLAIEDGKIVAKSASEWADVPVIEPLTVDHDGTFNPPSGVDGYAPVTVKVGSTVTILDVTSESSPVSSATYSSYLYTLPSAVAFSNRGAARFSCTTSYYRIDGWDLNTVFFTRRVPPRCNMIHVDLSTESGNYGSYPNVSFILYNKFAFSTNADAFPCASGKRLKTLFTTTTKGLNRQTVDIDISDIEVDSWVCVAVCDIATRVYSISAE